MENENNIKIVLDRLTYDNVFVKENHFESYNPNEDSVTVKIPLHQFRNIYTKIKKIESKKNPRFFAKVINE